MKWEKLFNSPPQCRYHDALKEGRSVAVSGLWNATKALTAAIASHATQKHVLILTGASLEEIRLFNDFAPFTDRKVIDFPHGKRSRRRIWHPVPTLLEIGIERFIQLQRQRNL